MAAKGAEVVPFLRASNSSRGEENVLELGEMDLRAGAAAAVLGSTESARRGKGEVDRKGINATYAAAPNSSRSASTRRGAVVHRAASRQLVAPHGMIPTATGDARFAASPRTDNCPQPRKLPLFHALDIRLIQHFDSSAHGLVRRGRS